MRRCFRCKKEKPEDQFLKWYPNRCKDCEHIRDKQRYEKRRDYLLDYFGEWYKKNGREDQKINIEKARNWQDTHLKEHYAKIAVYNAIKSGKITRSPICLGCKREVRTEGHHPDYNYKLSVIWLCRSCHKTLHNRGLLLSYP